MKAFPSLADATAKIQSKAAVYAEFQNLSEGEKQVALKAVQAKLAENEVLKAKVASSKATLAALQRAKAVSSAAKPTAAPSAPKLTAAADFATAPLVMNRAEWSKMTASDKSRFFTEGNKLVD